eukprot:gene12745-15994_t
MDISDAEFEDAMEDFSEHDSVIWEVVFSPREATFLPISKPTAEKTSLIMRNASARMDEPPQKLISEYPLHRAAWYNDVDAMRELVKSYTRPELKELDCQGNSCQCFEMALMLYKKEMEQLKAKVKSKRKAMLETLRGLPDCSLQLNWELSSSLPGVGMLVRRYAPHDTYTIYKQGSQIRVDGTLMGIDKEGSGMLPEWKRGNFSLLYDTSGETAVVAFVNHKKKTWVNLKEAKKQMKPHTDSSLELEVLDMMSRPAEAKKIKVSGFQFKAVSGWLHSTVHEKVEGWNTQVYEGSGHLVSTAVAKAPYELSEHMSFEDYLATAFKADTVTVKQVNPMSEDALMGGKKKKRVSDAGVTTTTFELENGKEGRKGAWQRIDGKWHKVDGKWETPAVSKQKSTMQDTDSKRDKDKDHPSTPTSSPESAVMQAVISSDTGTSKTKGDPADAPDVAKAGFSDSAHEGVYDVKIEGECRPVGAAPPISPDAPPPLPPLPKPEPKPLSLERTSAKKTTAAGGSKIDGKQAKKSSSEEGDIYEDKIGDDLFKDSF